MDGQDGWDVWFFSAVWMFRMVQMLGSVLGLVCFYVCLAAFAAGVVQLLVFESPSLAVGCHWFEVGPGLADGWLRLGRSAPS